MHQNMMEISDLMKVRQSIVSDGVESNDRASRNSLALINEVTEWRKNG